MIIAAELYLLPNPCCCH